MDTAKSPSLRLASSPGSAPATPTKNPELAQEEHALCQRIAEGDERAFETLVERYQHRIFGFCLRMLGDRGEAEDVAQDVFLTLYRNASEFRGDSSFSTWIYRVAKNQSLNRIKYLDRRGRSRHRSLQDLGDERLGVADEGQQPDAQIEDGQRAKMVQEAIAQLGEEHRTVVVLRDMEGLSYEEIAEMTSLRVGTVKSRIHRARSALANKLARMLK